MIDAKLLQALQGYFDKQQLVQRAIDPAADAFREWYSGQPSTPNIDSVGLYPRLLSIDMTIPTTPVVITTLMIGLPDPNDVWFMGIVPLGHFHWKTTLEGQYYEAKLSINKWDISDLYDEAYPATLPLPTYPLKAHGSAVNTMLYKPWPDTTISASLIDQLIAGHDWEACKTVAYNSGLKVIADWFNECPEEYASWTPATIDLANPLVRLIFRIDFDYPVFINIDFDVMGIPPVDSAEKPRRIGYYDYSILLDGTINDVNYYFD
ncbi:hypothetical protein ACP8Y2_15720 [Herpetosiphon llansteffanensis]